MLMRFDPFTAIDRALDEAVGASRLTTMPMDAYRHGDRFVIHVDLPGVDPSSIDASVEQNVLTISAERRWPAVEGDQVVVSERRQGTFRRQLFLGETLNTDAVEASYDNGVLTLTIPIAEQAKARKIEVTSGSSTKAIESSAA